MNGRLIQNICGTYGHRLALNFSVVSVQCESVGGILVGLVSIHQEALHKPCYAQINCKQATQSGDYYLLFPTAESPRRITFMGCPVALSAAMDQVRVKTVNCV